MNQSGQPAPDIAKINQSLVSSWVSQRVIAAVAAEHHVTVTDAEVTSFLDQVVQNAGRSGPARAAGGRRKGDTPPNLIPELIHYYLLGQKLPPRWRRPRRRTPRPPRCARPIADTAARLGVHVNPRYGQWDVATGSSSRSWVSSRSRPPRWTASTSCPKAPPALRRSSTSRSTRCPPNRSWCCSAPRTASRPGC